jgi:hypothetical protein
MGLAGALLLQEFVIMTILSLLIVKENFAITKLRVFINHAVFSSILKVKELMNGNSLKIHHKYATFH